MPESDHGHATPSATDGDGVRLVRVQPVSGRRWLKVGMLMLMLTAVGIGYLLYPAASPVQPARVSEGTQPLTTPATTIGAANERQPPTPVVPPTTAAVAQSPNLATSNPADWRTGDANDLATYASPGDPVPTMGELIKALRDSGETEGIAAFNPPGTSPPLQGLAVPEDYVLPEGYVRHHQVTDDGQTIEAILMYSPDYVFRDAAGQPITLPEDLVVPPGMAPPGLPIRQIEIPPPAE